MTLKSELQVRELRKDELLEGHRDFEFVVVIRGQLKVYREVDDA